MHIEITHDDVPLLRELINEGIAAVPTPLRGGVPQCRAAYPGHYIRVSAYDASLGRQTTALSFIVNRPAAEPGFRLDRQEASDRRIRYSLHPYATDQPAGER